MQYWKQPGVPTGIYNSGVDSYTAMLDMSPPNRYYDPGFLKVVYPDRAMDVSQIVRYKYQISPFKFSVKDDALDAYEHIFDNFQSAFVKLTDVETYVRSWKREETSIF